jgi:hypothetical protein
MKCSSPMNIVVPDILHTVYRGMPMPLMDWVTSLHKQHSRIEIFIQLRAMMPPYSGFAPLRKPYRQVTLRSGKERIALGHVIVPVFAPSLLNPSANHRIPFTETQLCLKMLLYFDFMAQYWYPAEAMMEYMDNYWKEFDWNNNVFI